MNTGYKLLFGRGTRLTVEPSKWYIYNLHWKRTESCLKSLVMLKRSTKQELQKSITTTIWYLYSAAILEATCLFGINDLLVFVIKRKSFHYWCKKRCFLNEVWFSVLVMLCEYWRWIWNHLWIGIRFKYINMSLTNSARNRIQTTNSSSYFPHEAKASSDSFHEFVGSVVFVCWGFRLCYCQQDDLWKRHQAAR